MRLVTRINLFALVNRLLSILSSFYLSGPSCSSRRERVKGPILSTDRLWCISRFFIFFAQKSGSSPSVKNQFAYSPFELTLLIFDGVIISILTILIIILISRLRHPANHYQLFPAYTLPSPSQPLLPPSCLLGPRLFPMLSLSRV
ncbi:hypothetical protein BDV32DRAFT_75952 [Aspergillus pseudonomiae]|nr:hypothetical protein BDV32DRAFT_75952 [Aspergillus pseudonomiae]